MGEGLKSGEIIEWFVRPGDLVKRYDMLCKIQSDKATVDVTSAYDGIVEDLSGSVGDTVAVGSPLCSFSCEGEHQNSPYSVLNSRPSSKLSQELTGSSETLSQQSQPPVSIKLTSYRRSMVSIMQQSASIPHCYAFDILRLSGVSSLTTAAAVKALAQATIRVPVMHAKLDIPSETYQLPNGVHVGIAVSTPSGLAVPCIRDADKKTIEDITADLVRLRRLAIARRLSKEDVEGATITLSNIGSIGLVSGLGTILPGQVALVTLGKLSRDTVQVSVSADHRLIDGEAIAAFLTEFREAIKTEGS
jgi:2-oxoisovalerate dehydrogenase E2 component (dihydrolipoyl transacylase)